jgi:V/A-type H+-transporting ATPase subunit E
MNGIDKITARIEQDSQREIDALLAEARAQAADITAQYQAKAQAQTDDILARGKQAAAQREERLASVAQLECRKAVLAAKQDVLEEAFDKALQKLLALPQEDYVALLAALAAQAASTGKEKLIFSQADRARVGKAVVVAANEKLTAAGRPASLTLAEETRPMEGGFVLSGGDVEVNCTFATLVRLQRSELAGQVAKVLFE